MTSKDVQSVAKVKYCKVKHRTVKWCDAMEKWSLEEYSEAKQWYGYVLRWNSGVMRSNDMEW